jgi:hypothetical protein
MGSDCALGQVVQMVVVEDVELLQAGVEEPVEPCKQRQKGDCDTKTAHCVGLTGN